MKVRRKCVPFGRKSTSKPFSSWAKCTCPLAAFLSNKHYSRCSISTRACAAGWLGAWLAGGLVGWQGHQNASKTRTLSTKVRQKRVPLGRKSFPKRGGLVGYGRNPKMILSQICIDFGTKTYRFGHISGPSYRGAHAGWPAGWVVRRMPAMRLEHHNASKMRPLHQKVRRKCDPSCRNCVSGCLTASFGEHFGAPKIAPLSMK